MGFFGDPKIDGYELKQCLDCFEAETNITAFQTKEADFYNDVMVKYSNSIMEDPSAAREASKAAKRLSQAATEIIRRHDEIKSVPSAASEMHYAWHVTFLANAAWASATAATMDAMANGLDPNLVYVAQLMEQYQTAWSRTQNEDKKFVKRLKVSSEEIERIIMRVNTEVAADDNWKPNI
ncbi:hypothetical protein ACFLS8_05700 [Chloroflexota bacterium]